MSIKIAAAILVALSLGASAQAAPAGSPAPTKVAEAAPAVQPAAVADEEDNAVCNRARRRLWVEGEGWIVRRVTTCR